MPEEHKIIHVITEAMAVFILAPYLIYLSFKQDNPFDKYFLIFLAICTWVVDGYLLIMWLK